MERDFKPSFTREYFVGMQLKYIKLHHKLDKLKKIIVKYEDDNQFQELSII